MAAEEGGEKKNTDKYRAIIEAAIRVFGEHGYHNARVVKIARAAGVAEGTVYLYFRNKEDLLVSAFREKMDEFTTRVERELAGLGEAGAAEKLRRLVDMHLQRLGGDYTLALFFQIHLRQPEDTVRTAIAGPLARYARVIEALAEEGMAAGEFLPGQNKKLIRQMVFGAMDEVVSNWVRARGKYSLPEQAGPVFAFLLRGLAGRS
ncbi:MAG TPA: TetR/AcrR family transcriptional regulator [Spirochaetia bacterium]|nr:TetR/AcrR family transcriptional regulator [Spirochaetia bacterium]